MRYLSNILALTTIIFLLFVPFGSNAFTFQQNELSKAIQLFDKKQYNEAEILFEQLLKKQPDDFMVNYFYGACRTENGHFSEQVLGYLLKASKEVSPLDIDYYLGMQYHAMENWDKALLHYETFGKMADAAEQERVKLSEKIEQCQNQVNPYTWTTYSVAITDTTIQVHDSGAPDTEIIFTDTLQLTSGSIQDSLYSQVEETDSTFTEEEPLTIEIPQPVDPAIDFNVNYEITYKRLSNFKTDEGKDFFVTATDRQKELDAVLKTAKNLREAYGSERNRITKDSLGKRILGLEERSYELKREVNQLFSNAKSAENEYWNNATEDEKITFIAKMNSPSEEKRQINTSPPDSEMLEIPAILIDNTAATKKPAEPANKDLSYKIQIGAYSRGLPTSIKRLFDKLSLIRKIDNYTDDRGVVVYTTGNLIRYEDAMTMLKQVQQEGVEDAIIAAYFKGKRIPLTEAKALEGIQ